MDNKFKIGGYVLTIAALGAAAGCGVSPRNVSGLVAEVQNSSARRENPSHSSTKSRIESEEFDDLEELTSSVRDLAERTRDLYTNDILHSNRISNNDFDVENLARLNDDYARIAGSEMVQNLREGSKLDKTLDDVEGALTALSSFYMENVFDNMQFRITIEGTAGNQLYNDGKTNGAEGYVVSCSPDELKYTIMAAGLGLVTESSSPEDIAIESQRVERGDFDAASNYARIESEADSIVKEIRAEAMSSLVVAGLDQQRREALTTQNLSYEQAATVLRRFSEFSANREAFEAISNPESNTGMDVVYGSIDAHGIIASVPLTTEIKNQMGAYMTSIKADLDSLSR